MDLKLHANATTTPRIRADIRQRRASNAAPARELGIHSRTVARWKSRTQVLDRSTRPHRLATTMTDWEEALVGERRRSLALPLDDITEAMGRCVNLRLSRSVGSPPPGSKRSWSPPRSPAKWSAYLGNRPHRATGTRGVIDR